MKWIFFVAAITFLAGSLFIEDDLKQVVVGGIGWMNAGICAIIYAIESPKNKQQ